MSEERVHAGPGWLATLLGGLVLVVLGFGLGLVVGAAREEPELVLRHLSGESTEVPAPAAPASPASPAPGAAASPAPAAASPAPAARSPELPSSAAPAAAPNVRPGPPPAQTASPAEAPKAPAPPAPPPVSSPPPAAGQRFSVQVGAFADSAQADKLADHLRHKGMRVFVLPAAGPRDSRWRVRIGPVQSRAEAERVAERLKVSEKLPTWVLAEGP